VIDNIAVKLQVTVVRLCYGHSSQSTLADTGFHAQHIKSSLRSITCTIYIVDHKNGSEEAVTRDLSFAYVIYTNILTRQIETITM
jgi:hypothetical protein